MKLKLLFFVLLITTISKAQEIFSTAFQGNLPVSLVTIEDELFVSVFGNNDERLAGVYKLPFDNSNTIETVNEASIQEGLGPLYLAYDSELNILFATLPDLIKIDLNQGLPAIDEVFIDDTSLNIGTNNGLIYHEGFIYFTVFTSGSNMIYRVDTLGASAPELFFEVTEADNNLVITQIINNELYYFKYNNSIGIDLMKINIADPSSEILISTVDEFEFFMQSSHVVNNILFVGVETINSSSPSIIKFDLTQNLPITGETVPILESINAVLGITSYQDDLYFTDGNSQNIFRLEDGALNVSEVGKPKISVFPNPTSNSLFIKGLTNNRIKYQLIDILGRIINEGVYTDEGIDFSSLETGVYFVNIHDTSGNISTRKVIKN